MSDKGSADEDYFGNHDDSDGKSPVDRSGGVGNDEGDPEIGLRDEEEEVDAAQEPEAGEDEDDAGYGGEDAYANREAGQNHDEFADQDEQQEEETMEIQRDKDADDQDFDIYDDDEEEEAYGEEPRKNRNKKDRKKKEKGESSGKRKKVKREGRGDEAEEDTRNEDEIDGGGSKKSKKKGKKEDVVDEEEVKNLIIDMYYAYKEDLALFKNKQPAVKKLQLLPRVEQALKKNSFQRSFIDQEADNMPVNGLGVISKWLAKLPNGSYPSLQIRKKLMDIIYHLPVNEDHLNNSEIGKVVYNMKNNPTEDPEVNKTIKDIIDKWTRIITDSANDYEVSHEDMRHRKKIDISLDEYRQRSMSSLRRSIPKLTMKKSGFDYAIKPRKETATRGSGNKQPSASDECDKVIKDMKRKMRRG